MKKNFYKDYQKKQKLAHNFDETHKKIIENQSLLLKLFSYVVAIIHSILKILLFLLIIVLLSVDATVIFNKLIPINLINMIGGNQ